MPASGPSFSPYPFAQLRRLSRADAAIESTIARFVGARPRTDKLAKLVGLSVEVAVVGRAAIGPHASLAEVRVGDASILVAGSSLAIRAVAQQVLGGPEELAAPRPLTAAEHAIWCLVVAAAVADLGIAGHVWPAFDRPLPARPLPTVPGHPRANHPALAATLPAVAADEHHAIELAVTFGAPAATAFGGSEVVAIPGDRGLALADRALRGIALAVVLYVPRGLVVQAPPRRAWPAWTLAVPVVVARTAVPRVALGSLAVGDLVTVESAFPGGCELVLANGRFGLTASPGAVEATVATRYLARDMALPDDAHVELTVQLGTTQLSLRTLAELSVGQLVSLGRPLSGPFEVRAGGRVVGEGELVDIDGELGVRIVSLAQE